MKIAVISTGVFRLCSPSGTVGYSGLEVLAWQQAKGLAERGHDVILIAPDGSECPGVRVVECGPEGRVSEEGMFGGFGNIMAEDKKTVLRPAHPGYWQALLDRDVVIDNSWQKWAYILKAEGRLTCPVLGVCHAPVNTMFGSPPPVEKPCIVCISQDQANHYEALFSPGKAKVCYNGVDTSVYRPLGIPRSGRFLFLARFSRIKGASLACDACREAGVGLDLVGDHTITGEPEYLDEVKRKCDGKQIRMVGPATRGECVWWFSQAHVLLHPNFPAPQLGHPGFREPFGLAPVEAMACSTPCIAGDYGAMRETISNGLAGWLVNSLEELVQRVRWLAVQESQDFRDIRDRCRDWASRFSIENMVARYEQLCQEAIEGGW